MNVRSVMNGRVIRQNFVRGVVVKWSINES
jgi:hypothetical protein